MKIAFYIALTLVWALYVADTTITLKPFSITFGKPYLPFAWILLIAGILLFKYSSYRDGVDDTIEEVRKIVNHKDK